MSPDAPLKQVYFVPLSSSVTSDVFPTFAKP